MHLDHRAADPGRVRAHPVTDFAPLIGIAALCAAGAEFALMRQAPAAPWLATLFPLIALIYVTTGLPAATRRPSSRLGLLMIIGGGVWLLSGLVNTGSVALIAVGAITRTRSIGVIIHLLIGFPTGWLHTSAERLVVIGGYSAGLLLEAPIWLFAPDGALSIDNDPRPVSAAITAQRVAGRLSGSSWNFAAVPIG